MKQIQSLGMQIYSYTKMANLTDEINEKVKAALEGVGVDGVEIMQGTAPDASGFLKDHIDYNLIGFKLSFTMPEYAKYVEYGTPPHFPPVEEIREWCKTVGVPEDAAWAIAKAIEKRGTRPQPFIRPFFNNKLLSILKKNLAAAFR